MLACLGEAFAFLPDGEHVETTLTFGELDRQARTIASHLAPFVNQRAVLVYPSGTAFVAALFGCLYAGVVAVHAQLLALDADNPLSRVEAVAASCRASVVLAESALIDEWDGSVGATSPLRNLAWYASDDLVADDSPLHTGSLPPADLSRLALIQFTSGTTGTSRGIPLRHSHVTQQAARLRASNEADLRSVTVGWTPLFHDMGFSQRSSSPSTRGTGR